MDEPLHEQPHAVPRCSRSREIICTICCRCFGCKEVTIVAINSLAIETQRNHKLCACIVKLYGNDGTATVAFICP